jgi:hypothetical protein
VWTCVWILDVSCPFSIHYYMTRQPDAVECAPAFQLTFGPSGTITDPPGCCAGDISSLVITV